MEKTRNERIEELFRLRNNGEIGAEEFRRAIRDLIALSGR